MSFMYFEKRQADRNVRFQVSKDAEGGEKVRREEFGPKQIKFVF